MADLDLAIRYTLSFEDESLSGVITHDAGGCTRFGIAEKFHPELAGTTFFTTMPSGQALRQAEAIYATDYCIPLAIDRISDQNVANKLLSLGTNCGVGVAARWLQEVVGVAVDGTIGILTIAATNQMDATKVVAGLKAKAVAYYRQLAQANPLDQQYLGGWLRRAEA
jgi:lysozyme family protein